jgi:4-amino-4-deoxy-L-arabinose transferase-like glycosyltransferase
LEPTSRNYTLGFALLGALFFLPFLGGVHLFDWDEINFAEISREMLILKDYTRVHVNFEPFFQKPPFYFWLQALAMKVIGVGDYAARLPNAICGIITLPLLFRIGQKLKNTRFGLLWAGAYFGSILPFLYFKSGIIDPWFNLFIFLGLYYFVLFYWQKEQIAGQVKLNKKGIWYLFLGGFWIGMGILTKGQVAYLIAVLTMGVYWIYQRFRLYISIPQFLFFTFAATLVTLTWYGLETLQNGPKFIYEFNKYQYRLFSTPDAGHKGFPGYHFIVLLVGCFPVSIFTVRAFFRMDYTEDSEQQKDFRRWMKFLFWTVLILFSIVQSKIVHYSSMCYFPLTYLAALSMEQWLDGKITLNRWMKTGLYGLGGLFILVTLALPFIGMEAEQLAPLFKDPFARGNLEADVHWSGLEVTAGLFLLGLLLFFGWQVSKGHSEKALYTLFGGTAVFVMLTLVFFIGRIEGYSQRASVEFFTEKRTEDCYLAVDGYKSYVHLFYGRPQQAGEACFQQADCLDFLLHGEIEKPAYIATKVHKADKIRKLPGWEVEKELNGFVFLRRMPKK